MDGKKKEESLLLGGGVCRDREESQNHSSIDLLAPKLPTAESPGGRLSGVSSYPQHLEKIMKAGHGTKDGAKKESEQFVGAHNRGPRTRRV